MDDRAPAMIVATDDESLRAAIAEAAAAHGLAVAFAAPGAAGATAPPAGAFRVGALLDRLRAAPAVPAAVAFGPFTLATADGMLHRAGAEALRLTEKERDILVALHAAAGTVVERGALLRAVWGYVAEVETHTLETHIYRLRQKIEDDPARPVLLVTEESGYRLAR